MGEEKRKNGCAEEKKWVHRTEIRVIRRGKMGEEKRKNGCGEEKKWVRRREIVLWGHCIFGYFCVRVTLFPAQIVEILEVMCPYKCVCLCDPKTPWVTAEVVKAINKRKKYVKKYWKTKNQFIW